MQLKENLNIAFLSLIDQKFRSVLTMLGIIFGTASVIIMVSIGEGAKRTAIAKYQDLGIRNIIIRDKALADKELEEVRMKFSPGLSVHDAEVVAEIVPDVVDVACQAEADVEARYGDKTAKGTIIGVTPSISGILNYSVRSGAFIQNNHCDEMMKVCAIGASLARALFGYENPVGKNIKLGDQWFEVMGVMNSKALFTETIGELAARDLNNDIYIPLTTFKSRIPPENSLASEINQFTVKLNSSEQLIESTAVIRSILNRHHYNNDDFSIIVPFELLKQEEKERRRYNFLLASIAAISLIVGGIGIMNIMLASVVERTREIGIRRALGGRRSDILSQFITEAVIMSLAGGLTGVILGILLSLMLSLSPEISTSIKFYSLFIAFAFSLIVGITFGYLPAKKAANLEPIESIRHE